MQRQSARPTLRFVLECVAFLGIVGFSILSIVAADEHTSFHTELTTLFDGRHAQSVGGRSNVKEGNVLVFEPQRTDGTSVPRLRFDLLAQRSGPYVFKARVKGTPNTASAGASDDLAFFLRRRSTVSDALDREGRIRLSNVALNSSNDTITVPIANLRANEPYELFIEVHSANTAAEPRAVLFEHPIVERQPQRS